MLIDLAAIEAKHIHPILTQTVIPRPVAWVLSLNPGGDLNLAPYSFFNAISDHPKMVMFASSGRKDTLRNVEETKVFTTSMVGRELASQVNLTSADSPYGESEFGFSGLTVAEARLINAPFVAEAHAALECKVTDIFQPRSIEGEPSGSFVVIGQVVGIHIDDAALVDGRLDMAAVAPLARLGYMDYADGGNTFQMRRPPWPLKK